MGACVAQMPTATRLEQCGIMSSPILDRSAGDGCMLADCLQTARRRRRCHRCNCSPPSSDERHSGSVHRSCAFLPSCEAASETAAAHTHSLLGIAIAHERSPMLPPPAGPGNVQSLCEQSMTTYPRLRRLPGHRTTCSTRLGPRCSWPPCPPRARAAAAVPQPA